MVPVGTTVPPEAAAAGDAVGGTFNFCPTLICVVFRLLSFCNSLMVVLCALAILLNVSPDLTV